MKSPHAEAIALVLKKQGREIAKAELKYFEENGDEWWSDTITRSWSVKRPSRPGIIDTSHLLVVTYALGEKVLFDWAVDTRERTVE